MPTLINDPAPPEIQRLIERRRELGQDRLDEVWEGVYVMNPAPHINHVDIQQALAELLGPLARARDLIPRIGEFNIGTAEDYRIPDGALMRPSEPGVYMPTAALVIEIVSPGDDTWRKLPFYAEHHVDELLIIEPREHSVSWLALTSDGRYEAVERSALIDLGPAALASQLPWPA